MRSALTLFTVLAVFAPQTRAASETKDPTQRESLEQFLERARVKRQEVQQKLSGAVGVLVKDLELDKPQAAALAATVEKLIALGAEATPLLVPLIDPGDAAVEKERVRAQQVAAALMRMDTSPITDELLALLKRASNEGKRNALRVLATCADRVRVRAPIEALFRSAEGGLKQSALKSLIAMGGPENDALLAEVLGSPDENLVAIAISGLAESKNAGAVDQIRKILAHPTAGARHVLALLGYFHANPGVLKDQDVLAFVRIAQSATLALETRVGVVDALATLEPKLDSELRKALETLADSPDRKLHESALVLLARIGDKNAKRELVKEADDVVDKNPRWAEAYVRRADLYARIGDDDAAIKDYRDAISIGRDDPTLQPGTFVKLARALVRKGKLKDAGETLRHAPISLAELQALADDEEFAPLRNSKYGNDAFGLK